MGAARCFGTNEIALFGWKFDEIESSSRQRVAHCSGATVYELFDPGG
jgi:hypothetical protein